MKYSFSRLLSRASLYGRVFILFIMIGVFSAVSWFTSVAFGQSRTTCGLAGEVEDDYGNPLPGATVQIVSPDLIGGPRTTTTDEQGPFRFLELPPGIYKITMTLTGYKTIQVDAVRLLAGMTTEIPIEMTLYVGEETVIVEAQPNPIDPTTSAMPTVLPQEYLKNIPTDRDTSHIMNLAPGINIETAYGGAEESGIAYQMDGVDISDPQGGAPWSFFNYSLIDEVELIGLGAPAEYGQFTGVVFNTITKSGGNQFSGSAELFYTNKNLTASNSEFVGLFPTIEEHQEESFQMGGPIKKDKLWYFVSAQYLRDESSEGGPIETEKDPRLFFKLTWQASPKNTLQGWLEWDHQKIIGRNADAFTPLEATTGEDNSEFVGNLMWKSQLSDHSVLSVAWGGYSGHRHFNPHNGFLTPGHLDARTGIASVNAAQFGIVERDRNQVNASLAHQVSNSFTGYHYFKFGTEIERSVVRDRYGYPGGAFFMDNEGPEQDPSIVVRDIVREEARLKEATDDWFAINKDGNVWYCGEEVKDYESFEDDRPVRPELVSIDGSFKAGRDDDKPGIIFRARPKKGEFYIEEFSLGNAEDVTGILSANYSFGSDPELDEGVPQQLAQLLCSGNCVVTNNFSLLEPGISARKYYAVGVGFFLEVEEDLVIQLVSCNFDDRCANLPTP